MNPAGKLAPSHEYAAMCGEHGLAKGHIRDIYEVIDNWYCHRA